MDQKQCKLIILEGVDRSGKGTMWDEIHKQTGYQHIIIDRGPIGFKAYARIFGRDQETIAAYERMEKNLVTMDALEKMSPMEKFVTQTIYLDCSTEELVKRCKRSNHEVLDFDTHKAIYEEEVKHSRLHVIKVDTTLESIECIVSRLIAEGVL